MILQTPGTSSIIEEFLSVWRRRIMSKSALTILIAILCLSATAFAKETLPTKSHFPLLIAPDLTVVSAEFGAFPSGKGPKDKKGKAVVFVPTDHADKIGFSYGWRIKLETPRKTVHVYPAWSDHNDVKVRLGAAEPIVDGYIYQDWDEVGAVKHKHSMTVYIEGTPVKTFEYFTN
jgi:hypothetical protein